MSQNIAYHLLHGTSLISRGLAMRIGGFDERLKLGADIDFMNRAALAGRIVNLPVFYYFRRVRSESLTTHDQTGYHSAARMIEDRFVLVRGRRNLEMVRAGQAPQLFVKQNEPVGFIHHKGPGLRLMSCGLSG
jgi:GT2 family glycosyltransferase